MHICNDEPTLARTSMISMYAMDDSVVATHISACSCCSPASTFSAMFELCLPPTRMRGGVMLPGNSCIREWYTRPTATSQIWRAEHLVIDRYGKIILTENTIESQNKVAPRPLKDHYIMYASYCDCLLNSQCLHVCMWSTLSLGLKYKIDST